MIAHEVKNPLQKISLITKGLEANNELPKEKSESINQAIEDLDEIINFLNILSRGENLKDIKIDQKVYLYEVIERVSRFLGKINEDINPDVEIRLEKDQLIYGNNSLINHLFLNLIKNAIEYMREQQVKPHILVTAHKSNDNLIVELSNNGPQLDLISQAKLFTNFTSKPVGQGTGLGLILCRKIMDTHGGKIEFLSDGDKPTFRLTF
jgi:signal transduction histidine kinase